MTSLFSLVFIRWFLVLTITIVSFIFTTTATGPDHNKVVVCYIATWAVYRTGKGSYSIENFDPNLCTHVIYAFAGLDITKDAIKSLDPWQDLKDDYGKGGYERITKLRSSYPHLKVSLAIGGWNEGSKNYSILSANAERRQRFVKQTSEFIRKYNFDGLDLDWEYPTQRGGNPEDRENFVALVKELKSELGKYKLLLTSAIGASKKVIDEAYDVRSLALYLDYFHIMCYDYGGSWDKKVGANAPLAGEGPLNVEFTIDYMIKMGAPPEKIIVGIPFYGRTFRTPYDGYFGDVSDEVGFQGPFTKENGFLGYNEICNLLTNKSSGWSKDWDAGSAQAIARFKEFEKGETLVVTYDSSRSVANKMRYAMRKNLGGAMVWSIDTDDFLGECELDTDTYMDVNELIIPGVELPIPKRTENSYPLLRTINEGINMSLNEIRQEKEIREKDKENEIQHKTDEENKDSNKTDDDNSGFKLYDKTIVNIMTISCLAIIYFRKFLS